MRMANRALSKKQLLLLENSLGEKVSNLVDRVKVLEHNYHNILNQVTSLSLKMKERQVKL